MNLFSSLPWPITILFLVALVIVLCGHLWALILFFNGQRAISQRPDPDQEFADSLLWIFLVPALNEEVTIADSVMRLRKVNTANRVILVIDDGSADRTPEILQGLAGPDLVVLCRDLPQAQLGKAAALNQAWKSLDSLVLSRDEFVRFSRDQVVMVIVDADGRLDPQAPQYIAAHLRDPQVGGVQVSVRIYNRYNPLTWLQDAEFGVFGGLFQMGRTHWNTAGMGGNGQTNRLTALDAMANDQGPWRDTLTEDQDIGLRLIMGGWRNVHDVRTTVAQQGVSDVRRLSRQRTRWAQGNIQASQYLRDVGSFPHFGARLDVYWTLLQPALQLIIGVSTLTALIMAIFFGVPFISTSDAHAWLWLLVLFFLAFGQTALGCLTLGRGHGFTGYLRGLVTAIPYSFYAWLLWPVIVRAIWRQVTGRTGWAKTTREPVEPDVSGQSPA